jgi:S-formylglutathione hydrolase FrmB
VIAATVISIALAGLFVRLVFAQGRGYSSSHGNTIVHYELSSTLLGRRLSEVAIVPAGSGDRPLLVLLHGRRDSNFLSWLIPQRSGPESILSDELLESLARLRTRAPVVVLLNGGTHSYYHDRGDGPWGSMILEEAIPDAIRRFHTQPGRVAIGGISMGGYGAFHLAGLASRRFCAIGGHSAALWESGGASAPGAFDNAEDFERNEVFAQATHGRYTHVPVWLDVGTDDPFRAADTAFATALRRRDVSVRFHIWPGAHEQSYWRAHVDAYIRFYAQALSTCAA